MNEAVQIISAAISSVGFPAVFCILLLRRTDEQSRTISEFTKSIDKLTAAVNRLFHEINRDSKSKKGE